MHFLWLHGKKIVTKKKPMPFQKETVEQTEAWNGRAVIASDMGLGKTLTSLWFVKRKRCGETLPLLIVVMLSVKHQWADAVREVLGIEPDFLETRTPGSINSEVAIITYDVLSHWKDVLSDHDFQTIIIDECHLLIHPERNRTRAGIELIKGIPFAMALSGTPLTNRPIELFPIINAINPNKWPDRRQFANKYCSPFWTRRGWNMRGACNLDDLNRRLLEHTMIRYKKSEVLDQLPPKHRKVIGINLRNFGEYKTAENDFLGWLRDNRPDKVRGALRAMALVKTGHLLRLSAKLKIKQVVGRINRDLRQNPHNKIVVLAVHTKCVNVLHRRIQHQNVVIDGSIRGPLRKKAFEQFLNNDKTRVLVGNITAAGTGLNLEHADALYVVEMPQTPGALLQAEDRIHRIGQESIARIFYFIAKNTVEESAVRMLARKQKVITATLDGDSLVEDFDLYRQIMEDHNL